MSISTLLNEGQCLNKSHGVPRLANKGSLVLGESAGRYGDSRDPETLKVVFRVCRGWFGRVPSEKHRKSV